MIVPLLLGYFFFRKNTALEKSILAVNTIIAANGFTAVFLVPWTMITNVLDEYLLNYHNKLDALFYTFFALGVKVFIAIFAGLTQLILR